jgi:hypothetical protein
MRVFRDFSSVVREMPENAMGITRKDRARSPHPKYIYFFVKCIPFSVFCVRFVCVCVL